MKTNYVITTFLATILMVIAKTFAEPDPNFHIYLAFGQSNMLSGGIEDQDKNVDSRFQMISTVSDCGDRHLGEWYTAVPPLASCEAGLGPVPYFGNTLVEKLPKEIKVGVAVVGIAGCDIQLFEKDRYQQYEHADWMTYFIEQYGGNPYGRLVDMGKKGQEVGVIKGILVHQGETNNGNQDWPMRLKGVYENILSDLGLKAEDVPLLVGELVQSSENGICGGMNDIIQKVPEVIPTAHVVSSEGLAQQGDGFHFTTESQRTFGQRYAEVMLDILDSMPTTEVDEPNPSTSSPSPIEAETNTMETETNTNNNTDECFSTALGYHCCKSTTTPSIYHDSDGHWGIENGVWCGIPSSICWSQNLGYPCCSSSSTTIYYINNNGQWGIENNNWCGI